MRVVFTTYGFPSARQSFIETYVRGIVNAGADVCVVASAEGDRVASPPPSCEGAGTLEVVHAAWSTARGRKILTLAAVLRDAARHQREPLARLVRALRRRYGTGHVFVRELFVLAPVLSRAADVVHVGWLTAATRSTELLAVIDTPIVVSCHGSDLRIDPLLGPRYRTPLAEVFERVDLVHCVSHELAEEAVALGLDPGKVFVCSWGVDTGQFTPRATLEVDDAARNDRDRPLRVVAVGRIHWVKGYEFALQALARVREAGVAIDYTIIGEADDTAMLAVLATARDLGLDPFVRIRGSLARSEVVDALRSADVFLLASLSEGLSTATLEAMAVGLPVVVTDVGGMREAVNDGREGFVVPPRDPDAIAAALVELAGDPGLRRAMGRRGHERVVADFDAGLCARAMLEQYERLVAARA